MTITSITNSVTLRQMRAWSTHITRANAPSVRRGAPVARPAATSFAGEQESDCGQSSARCNSKGQFAPARSRGGRFRKRDLGSRAGRSSPISWQHGGHRRIRVDTSPAQTPGHRRQGQPVIGGGFDPLDSLGLRVVEENGQARRPDTRSRLACRLRSTLDRPHQRQDPADWCQRAATETFGRTPEKLARWPFWAGSTAPTASTPGNPAGYWTAFPGGIGSPRYPRPQIRTAAPPAIDPAIPPRARRSRCRPGARR